MLNHIATHVCMRFVFEPCFCNTELGVLSSFAIVSLSKRELVAFSAMFLFLAVPRVPL